MTGAPGASYPRDLLVSVIETPRRILLASTSAHKLREMEALLDGLSFQVLTAAALPSPLPTVQETGATFRENACLKALSAARAMAAAGEKNILVLADDSGLVVHALNGAPGVRSSRFAGLTACGARRDQANTAVLLKRLEKVPDSRRTACFSCSLALAMNNRIILTASGSVSGRILKSSRGREGFGYDPVFLHIRSGRTLGEMSAVQKAEISHRGRAMRRLRRALAELKLKP
ncbi:MAG: RdgB/HAM1 family non-canonical purine NTP pyrophosphatase [Acidobacteriota bacterium]